MANKFEYTIKLNADTSQIEKSLSNLTNQFQNTGAQFTLGKDTANITAQFQSIKKALETPITSVNQYQKINQELKDTTKQLKDVKKALDDLSISSPDKQLKILPQQQQNNIKQVKQQVKDLEKVANDYNKALEALNKNAKKIKTPKQLSKLEDKYTTKKESYELAKLKNEGLFDNSTAKSIYQRIAIERNLNIDKRQAGYSGLLATKEALNNILNSDAPDEKINKVTKRENGKYVYQKQYLEKLKADLATVNDLIDNYNKQLANIDKLDKQKNEVEQLKNAWEKVKNESEKATKEQSNKQTIFDDIEKQWNDSLTKLSNLGLDISEIKGGDFEELQKRLEGFNGINTQNARNEIEKLKNSTSELIIEVEKTGDELDKTGGSIVNFDKKIGDVSALESRLTYFFSTYNALRLMKSGIKQAVAVIKELDKAMTETAVVTDFSVSDMWEKLPEYTRNANDLGVSVKSMYDAATLYYQQGLKTNEVMQLSVETLKMARIAGLDASVATDRMTNALRAFNMELDQSSAQRVNDVYSKVAAISASNVNELSTAMTKVASLASNVGMSFEQTTSYLATGIETTRESADSVGTALKTVLARFAEMKKDPSMQETVDGEAVDVNKVETALRSVGIALRNESGQIREMGDVFEELNAKWAALDVNTQRYIATTAAGSRQQSRFIAMMADYTRTQELYSAALNSNGASQKQFEKTLESLETKTEKLKNAWNTFLMTLANNEMVKKAIDVLTNLITGVNNFLSSIESGSARAIVSIGMIGGAFLGLKTTILKVMSSIMGSFKISSESGESFGLSIGESALNIKRLWDSLDTKGKAIDKFFKKFYEDFGLLGFQTKNTIETLKDLSSIGISSLISGFKKLGDSIKKFLATGQASFIGYIAALTLIVITTKQLINTLKNNSIEAKLKTVNDELSKTEDHIKSLKDNLSEINNLSQEMTTFADSFNDLTKGSQEWNQALIENNSRIIELTGKYDKLQTKVNENGALVITDESIQAVYDETLKRYNNEIGSQALLNVASNQLSTEAGLITKSKEINQGNRKDIIAEAKAYAKAGKSVSTDDEFFEDWAIEEKTAFQEMINAINTADVNNQNACRQLAISIINDMDTTNMTDIQKQALTDIATKNSDIQAAIANGISQMGMISSNIDESITSGITTFGTSAGAIIGGLGAAKLGATIGTGITPGVGTAIGAAAGFIIGKVTELIAAENESSQIIERAQKAGLTATRIDKNNVSINGEDMSNEAAAYRIATAEAEQKTADTLENIQEILQNMSDDQASMVAELINGSSGNFARGFITSKETNIETYFQNVFGKSIKSLADEFGIDYSIFIEQINNSLKQEQSQQQESMRNALVDAMNAQQSQATIKWIATLDANSIDALNNATSTAVGIGPEALETLYDVINKNNLTSIDAQEFFTWLNTTSFADPINGLNLLNEATQNANSLISTYATKYKELNKENYTASKQIASLLNSANYEELNKELDKFLKKNNKITGEKVTELAQSYEALSQVMENTNIQASKLAQILTSIKRNNVNISALSDEFFKLRAEISNTTDGAESMHDAISAFKDPIDAREGINFISDTFDKIDELITSRAYGNSALETYFEVIFDPNIWRQKLNSLKTTEEIQKFYEDSLNSVKRMKIGNGYGFWEDLAKGVTSPIKGMSAQLLSNGDIQFEIEPFITYDEILENIQQAYGLTKETANNVLQGLVSNNVELQRQLNINGYIQTLDRFVSENTNEIISTNNSELQAIADTWGQTLETVVSDMNKYTAATGKKLNVYNWEGVTADNIDEFISGEANRNRTINGQQYANFNGILNKGKAYDYNALKNMLAASGLDEGLLDAGVNALLKNAGKGTKIATEVTIYNSKGEAETGTVSADTVEQLLAKVQNIKDTNDYQKQAESFVVKQDNSAIGQAIKQITNTLEAIKTILTTQVAKDESKYLNFEQSILEKQLSKDKTLSEKQLIQIGFDNEQIEDFYTAVEAATNQELTGTKYTKAIIGWLENAGYVFKNAGKELTEADIAFTDAANKSLEAAKKLLDNPFTVDVNVKVDFDKEANSKSIASILSGDREALIKQRQEVSQSIAKRATNNTTGSQGTWSTDDKSLANGRGSSADYIERQYDWLYNLQQKINKEQQTRNLLQKQYNILLKTTLDITSAMTQATENQVDSLISEINYQKQFYEGRKTQYQQLMQEASNRIIRGVTDNEGNPIKDTGLGSGVMTVDFTKYAWIENGRVVQDYNAIQKASSDVDTGAEFSSGFQEYLSSLESINSDMYSSLESIQDNTQELISLRDSGRDTFTGLIERIATALENIDQKAIDLLEKQYDAINDLNNEIVQAIEKNIGAIRKDIDNQNKQQDLTKLQRRIAYLQQDTTGANQAELLQLQKQLDEDTRSYQDSLVDQAIEQITNDNEQAAAQRERQIELQKSQLEWNKENGVYTKEAEALLIGAFDENNNIRTENKQSIIDVLSAGENWKGLADSTVGSNIITLSQDMSTISTWATANETPLDDLIELLSTDQEGYLAYTTSGIEGIQTWLEEQLTKLIQESNSNDNTENYTPSNSNTNNSSSNNSSNNNKKNSSSKYYGAGTNNEWVNGSSATKPLSSNISASIPSEYKSFNSSSGSNLDYYKKLYKKLGYATGGLADFTGPAWLDGTKSKPELVLNATDTANFIALKNTLADIMKQGGLNTTESSNNYMFDIDVNVDEMNSDYDAYQMAEAVKQQIQNEMQYRNVTTIGIRK